MRRSQFASDEAILYLQGLFSQERFRGEPQGELQLVDEEQAAHELQAARELLAVHELPAVHELLAVHEPQAVHELRAVLPSSRSSESRLLYSRPPCSRSCVLPLP
jgi:hypothetical protein